MAAIYQYNVPQPIPFYSDINGQNFRRIQCQPDDSGWQNFIVYKRTPRTLKAPRLDIKRVKTGASVTQFAVYNAETDSLIASCPTSGWNNTDIGTDGTDDFEVLYRTEVYFDPGAGMSENVPYYFKVASGGIEYFSEVFYIANESAENDLFPAACDDGQRFIKIRYENTGAVMNMYYTDTGSGYFILIPAQLGQPTYQVTKNRKENGAGSGFDSLVRIAKRFRFFIAAPEYVADLLNTLPLFQSVKMQFPNGEELTMQDIEVETNWGESACFAEVSVAFTATEAYDIVRTACP